MLYIINARCTPGQAGNRDFIRDLHIASDDIFSALQEAEVAFKQFSGLKKVEVLSISEVGDVAISESIK
jgi:hypothetical protein